MEELLTKIASPDDEISLDVFLTNEEEIQTQASICENANVGDTRGAWTSEFILCVPFYIDYSE